MKIFSGIFKRTYRSLKNEFKKTYRLNQLYLNDKAYADKFVLARDYEGDSSEVGPSADPSIVSDSQRMMQAQAVLELAKTTPGVNIYEAQKAYLKALKVHNVDQILPDPKGPHAIKPTPNPKVQVEQMKIQDKQEDRKAKLQEFMLNLSKEAELNQAKIMKLEADAIRAIAEAGGVATGHEIAFLNAQIAAENSHKQHIASVMKIASDLHMSQQESKEPTSK